MVAGPLSLSVIKCLSSHSPVNKAICASLTYDSWKQWSSKCCTQRRKSFRSLIRDILPIAWIHARRKLPPLSFSSASVRRKRKMASNAGYSLTSSEKKMKPRRWITNFIRVSKVNRIRIQRKICYHELKRYKVAFMFKQATYDGRHRLHQNPPKVH